MSSRLTKKSLVSVSGRLVKTPCVDFPAFAPRTRRPPTRTVISGAVSLSNCALIHQQLLGRQALLAVEIVAEPVRFWFERLEGFDVGLFLRRVHAPRRERDFHVEPGVLRGFLDRRIAAENDQVSQRDFFPSRLPPDCEALNSF